MKGNKKTEKEKGIDRDSHLWAPCFKVKDSSEEMLAIFDHLMGVIRNEALPLKVETTLQYSVNRNKNGWAVYLHNTKGLPAQKAVFYGKAYPGIDRTRTGKARITIPEQAGKVKKVIDWWTGKEIRKILRSGGLHRGSHSSRVRYDGH